MVATKWSSHLTLDTVETEDAYLAIVKLC